MTPIQVQRGVTEGGFRSPVNGTATSLQHTHYRYNVRSSLCTTFTLLSSGLWDGVVLWLDNKRFNRIWFLHLHSRSWRSRQHVPPSLTKYKLTRRHNPTDHHLRSTSGYWKTVWERPSFFWDVTRRRLLAGYRRFGKAYSSHVQGSGSSRTAWPLKLELISWPETSGTNYQPTPRNITEQQKLHSGGSLKPQNKSALFW